jgi:hypothetical protein
MFWIMQCSWVPWLHIDYNPARPVVFNDGLVHLLISHITQSTGNFYFRKTLLILMLRIVSGLKFQNSEWLEVGIIIMKMEHIIRVG